MDNTKEKIIFLQEGLNALPIEKSINDLITADKFILENMNLFSKMIMKEFIRLDLKKKFNFSKVQIDMLVDNLENNLKGVENTKIDFLNEILETNIINEISVGQDFINEIFIYGANINDRTFFITSDRNIYETDELTTKLNIKAKYDTVTVSKIVPNTIKIFIKDKLEEIRVDKLFEEIKLYYQEYMYFDDNKTFDVLSIWTMLTYIYKCFRYTPYILLNADKGSGKSRLLELAQDLCFNPLMSASTSPASIFRYVDSTNATLLIDEAENLLNDNKSDLNSILNSGFQAEGRVTRTKTDDNSYKIQNFSSYSPKALAGINDLPDVLIDRCIKVNMLKKPSKVNFKRYKKDEMFKQKIEAIVQKLYLFGLLYAKDIKALYDSDRIRFSDILSDRDKDIWEPMLAIAIFIDTKENNELGYSIESVLTQYSEEKSKERSKSDMENNSSYKLLFDLNNMLLEKLLFPIEKNGVSMYNNEELLNYLNDKCEHNFSSVTQLTKKLNKFNVKVERMTVDGKKQKYYIIDRTIIDDLLSRYNIANVVDQ